MTNETKQTDALDELIKQLGQLDRITSSLYKLRNDNMFRFLSKDARNSLLDGLMEKSGAVEDAAKATHRALKKIKRERLPEEVADMLLAGLRHEAIAYVPVVTGVPVTDDEVVDYRTDAVHQHGDELPDA